MTDMQKRIVALLLVIILITPVFVMVISADAGDFAGDNDFGGGWDDGGGWDNDDRDGGWYDGGGRNNDNYSSGKSSGQSSGQSREHTKTENIFIAIGIILAIGFPITGIVLNIYWHYKDNRGNKKTNYVNVGDRSTPQSKLTSMSKYIELDPDFSEDGIKSKVSDIYVQMQNNWTKKDFSPMRPYFSDTLYAQFERQLQQKTDQGVTNHIDNINVESVVLRGFYQENGFDHIVIKLQTSIVIYTTKDGTDQIIAGSRSQTKLMTYEWDIMRTTGEITQKNDISEGKRGICPSCGAELYINSAAECPYCGSVIKNQKHGWVISSITALSQKTV